jgi:hypothetical protein
MRERNQLFFGLPLLSKEFQHPAIQAKIEQNFGGFFHQKSAPANRKTGFYANRDPNKQEVGCPFQGLSNGTTLMYMQSGRTVSLNQGETILEIIFFCEKFYFLQCRI